MGLKVTSKGDFKEPEAGRWLGICVQIIDLGTQTDSWQGKITHKRIVRIGWELPDQKMDDGRPMIVMRRYTSSIGKRSNLRRDLEAWRGKPFTKEEEEEFNLVKVLGKACDVILTPSESGRIKVTSLVPLKKGTKIPKPQNPLIAFDLDAFDKQAFAALSEKTQEVIRESAEWKAMNGSQDDAPEDGDASAAEAGHEPDADDDMPF